MTTTDTRGEFEKTNDLLKEYEHLGSIQEILDNNPEELSELLDTGSVTIITSICSFEITLSVSNLAKKV